MCVKIRRKSYWKKVCLGGLLGLLATCALALEKENLIFYNSFDKGFNADKSKGKAKAELVGKPQLVEGKFGKALEITSGKNGVAYPLVGNLRPEQGTISFWISPSNWDGENRDIVQMIYSTEGPKMRYDIQHTWFRCRLNFLMLNDGKSVVKFPAWLSCGAVRMTYKGLKAGFEWMRPGVWWHVTITWRKGEVRGYLNGVMQNETKSPSLFLADDKIDLLGKRFALGFAPYPLVYDVDPGCEDRWQPLLKKEFTTKIDEFAVFNRRLHPMQVAKLYKMGVTKLLKTKVKVPSDLLVKPMPTKGKVVFEAVLGPEPDKCAKAEIVVESMGRAADAEATILVIDKDGGARGEIATKRLLPGTNRALLRVYDKQGKLISQSEEPKIFELSAPEGWWNNKLGEDDIILPPWTPMTKSADTISCWGRTISFDGQPLPVQIKSNGEDLLASPISIDLKLDGKKLTFVNGKVDYPVATETKMERIWTAKAEGIELKVKTFTEFDGLIWTTLSVKNQSGKPISGLQVTVPLKKERATFIHTPQRTMDYPEKGNGWRVDRPLKYAWNDQEVSYVWLGDYERGIQWTTEGRKGWWSLDRTDEIQITPEKDQVLLSFDFIDSPCERKDFNIEFGLHPTPVKPPVKRSKRLGPIGTYGVVPYVPRPNPKDQMTEKEWHHRYENLIAKNPKFFGYTFINSLASYYGDGAKIHEYECYKHEWKNVPGNERTKPLTWSWISTCPTTAYADWQVWQIVNRVVHPEYRDWRGIYFDHGHTSRDCCNQDHGCGYYDEQGNLCPERKVLAMRQMMRRIYASIKGIDKEHPQGINPDYPVVNHMSGCVNMAYEGFADYIYDGENMSYTRNQPPNGHFMERLPLDFMAAEWSHTPWGYNERGSHWIGAYFMNGFPLKKQFGMGGPSTAYWKWLHQGKKPEKFDELIAWLVPREREANALCFLFDRTPHFPSKRWKYPNNHAKWQKVCDDFGFYKDDVEFSGYWKTKDIISGQTDKLKASIYKRKDSGKILIVIVNLNPEPVEKEITLNLKKLNLPDSVTWTDAETGEAVKAIKNSDGTAKINIKIPGRDYLFLLSNKK
jgi:hypothetical protein